MRNLIRFLAPLFAAFSLIATALAAPFTPGNVVVYRIGDGSAALSSNATAVFVDEYTPGGALVQTIALPIADSGSNQTLTASGTATSEGLLTRSADGNYIILTGYDTAPGNLAVGATAAAVPRVIGRIDASGSVDTSTTLGAAAFNTGNIRGGGSTNGVDLWATGSNTGVVYATLGATAGTAIATGVTNLRAVNVSGGQLYVSSASGTTRVATVGTGTPTSAGQAITNLPGYPTSGGSPYQFALVDLDPGVAGDDTLYVCDDGSGGVAKWSLIAGTWTLNNTVAGTCRGLAASVSGTTVTLYVTSTATSANTLRILTDTAGYNVNNNGTQVTIATAAAATVFRGVALTPGVVQPDLTVSISGPSSGVISTNYDYTISVNNGSAGSANPVQVDFTLPSGVTYVGSTTAGGFSAAEAGGVVQFTGGNVTNAGPVVLTVTVTAPATPQTITVSPGAVVADPLGATSESNEGNNASTDTVNTTISAAAQPDLSISVSGPTSGIVGVSYDYTLTVSNSGTADANSVQANFALPAGVTYVGATPAGGFSASLNGGTVEFTGGVVTTAAPVVLGVTVTPTSSGSVIVSPGAAVADPAATIAETNEANNASIESVVTTIAPIRKIHEVQGNGTTSPLTGQVVSVEAVVTGSYTGLSGFFIQEEDADADADPTTSEGIFVFNNTAVNVGDLVRVTGTVSEFNTGGIFLTEITAATVTTLATGQTLPTPVTVTMPMATATDWERYEGMRVTFSQTLTVVQNFELGRFGEVVLSSGGRLIQPTNYIDPNDNPASGTGNSTPNGAAVAAAADLIARDQIEIDDGAGSNPATIPFWDNTQNTLRAGSTVDNLAGILHHQFGTYRVIPQVTLNWTSAPRPMTPPAVGAANVKVGSFNVLNYFNGDGSGTGVGFPTSRGATSLAEFSRQRAKIIQAIHELGADIVGLMEIENDGNGPTSAIQDLVNGLNALAGPGTWAFVADPTDPVPYTSTPGGTDEIKVALIYKPASVTTVGGSVTSNSSAFSNGRSPVAQTFSLVSNGEKLTVVVNHFKSKGGSGSGADADQGDGQGAFNDSRRLQATALASFVNTLVTSSADPDILLLGDFNAYEEEDPIDILRASGLQTVINGSYSYIFDSQSGSLDHAITSAALAGKVTGSGKWHINADEPAILDYNLEFKNAPGCPNGVSCTSPDYYAVTPFRSSDHDPVLVGFNLAPAMFTLTSAIVGDGTVTATGITCPGDCNETVVTGTVVVLTAAANSGSVFASWTGCDSVTGAQCTVTVTADRTVTANFAALVTANIFLEGWQQSPYVVTPAGGTGTASYNPVTRELTLNLPYSGLTGTETMAHIHGPAARGANAGILFTLAAGSPKTDTVTVTAAQESDLLAGLYYVNVHTSTYPNGEIRAQIDTFGATPLFALTVNKAGAGTGTVTGTAEPGQVIDCGSDCAETVPNGKQVTLTAAASAGSAFTGWSGACSGTGQCVVTMDAAKSVTANFAPLFTLTSAIVGDGTVTATGIACPGDCNEIVVSGTVVVLTAAANSGSVFASWTGCDSVNGAQCTVTVTADRTVTANFAALITANIFLEGWQQSPYVVTPASGTGTASYNPVTHELTLNLTYAGLTGTETMAHIHGPAARGANAGILFTLPAGSPKTATVTVTPAQETDLIAGLYYVNVHTSTYPNGEIRAQIDTFGATQLFALTVNKAGAGGGTVTGTAEPGQVIDCGSDCAETVPNGKQVTLTAAASAGSTFTGWSGACTGTGQCVVTMDAAKSVTATFAISTYAVTPSAGANGTITPNTPQTVNHGATTSFTVTPSAGYTAVVNGTCGGNLVGTTYTTNAITANCTVNATFTQVTYTVTPSANANGTITPNTPQIVGHGGTTSFTVTPNTGYTASVGGTCGGALVGSTYTTSAITANCTVVASFTLKTYTVTPSAGSNGSISPNTPQTVNHGATTSFTVTPNAGFEIDTVTGCGGSLTGNTYTTGAITANCSVAATFKTANPPRLGNISTRGLVGTGQDVMIGGFVIGGSANKTVAIVATGPSLAAFGITNAMANPTLTLVRSSDQTTIATNDDWQNGCPQAGACGTSAQLTAAGFAPSNNLEAAMLVNLPPGAYTAIVGGGTGVSVIGVYEVDGPTIPLTNISTRGRVGTGNDVLIGGFVIQGSGAQNVAIVATGPSLGAFGITGPLANPTIQLVRSSDQAVIATNDDWQADANQAQLQAAGFAPTNNLESGLYRSLPPGAYTVIVSGVNNGTGVAVIGVYRAN